MVAVVIALHEVKIAPRIAADEIVDPAEGMLHCVMGRGQRGPAKIENVAAQNERLGLAGSGVNGLLVPRRLGAAGTEMKVGEEVGLHVLMQAIGTEFGSRSPTKLII